MNLDQPRPMLADGAMGTLLYSTLGLTGQPCFEALNLTQPDAVAGIHAAYLQAGAQIIKTNSFGASRMRLAAHGLADQVQTINTAAARLARQAVQDSGRRTWVAGSIGPLGARLAPYGRLAPRRAEKEITEQVDALCAAGVDALLLETHLDLAELLLALHTARRLTPIPIFASLTFTRDDRTMTGDSPATAARELHAAGADVLGANCSEGPSQLLRILEVMRTAAPAARLLVMPNAGWPERAAGRILYPATAGYFAAYAASFAAAGASIIGGCCGTTPAHIAAMRQTLESAPAPVPVTAPSGSDIAEPILLNPQPSAFASKLARKDFVLAVEMDPPRSFSTEKLVAGGSLLAEAGADVLNVADSPMARMRMSPWAVCHVLQQQVGIDTVLHFPTRGRNLLRIQGDLLAAHALGIRNLFVVMGDPTVIGDYPQASAAYDVVPTGLLRIIKHGLNAGVDQAGAAIGDPTSFFAGAALNPFAEDPEREMGVLRRKLEAGADFLLTQPIFEPDRLRGFLDRYRRTYGPLPVPILAGLLPLVSERHAAFLANEVPGVHIPESVVRRLRGEAERVQAEGLRLAIDTAHELRGIVDGLYLMPPFGRYDLVAEIIESVKAAGPTPKATHGGSRGGKHVK